MNGLVPTRDEVPRFNLLMRSGNWVNLYDPSAKDIVLEDWVVGASRAARWGGQTKGDTAFNVLQHSLLVDDILTKIVAPGISREARLVALMHDLHEGGGLGDIVTPYGKLFATSGLNEVKKRLDVAIFGSIGLASPSMELKDAVKLADTISAVSEAVQLMDWPVDLARRDVGNDYAGPLWTKPIVVMNEKEARAAWMERFLEFKDIVKELTRTNLSVGDENESLDEARLIAVDKTLVKLAWKSIAPDSFDRNTRYEGKVLGVTAGHVVQNLGLGTAVIHRIKDLDRVPEKDAMADIRYDEKGMGTLSVKNEAVQEIVR